MLKHAWVAHIYDVRTEHHDKRCGIFSGIFVDLSRPVRIQNSTLSIFNVGGRGRVDTLWVQCRNPSLRFPSKKLIETRILSSCPPKPAPRITALTQPDPLEPEAYLMSLTCCQAVFALPRRSALVAIPSSCIRRDKFAARQRGWGREERGGGGLLMENCCY